MASIFLTAKGLFLQELYRHAISLEIPFNTVYNVLKQYGLSYRRQDMLNDWNIIKGYEKMRNTMKYVPRAKLISDKLYIPTSKPLPKKYTTKFYVKVLNRRTKAVEPRFAVIRHDSTLRRQDLEEDVMKMFEQAKEVGSEDVDILSLMPIAGWKYEIGV